MSNGAATSDAMNFLNRAAEKFPTAISLAAGRPALRAAEVKRDCAALSVWMNLLAARQEIPMKELWSYVGQYGETNGVIREWIAQFLARDENIKVEPSAIMVTSGAQEALAVLLAGLCGGTNDVLLVRDPAYVGVTGVAAVLGVRVVGVPTGRCGLEAHTVDEAITEAGKLGCVKALYDIPDFNNPLGVSTPEKDRLEVLRVCQAHGVLVIEDNAYGMLTYDGERRQTLKALDRDRSVVYVGTFSKLLHPGLRVGYLVADQRVGRDTLAESLSRVKSFMTVNTSPITQGIVAGVLIREGGTLRRVVSKRLRRYRKQRDTTCLALARAFSGMRDSVSWYRPSGGFFLPLRLPFEFGMPEVLECASQYGVIVCPMQWFCISVDRAREVRLSFSGNSATVCADGVERLARFVAKQAIR